MPLAVVGDAGGMRTATCALTVLLALGTLAGCSASPSTSTAAASRTAPGAHVTSTPGAPIVGAELEKITAWGECQQLVIKKLKLTDSIARKWSAQSEHQAAAAWVAVGHVQTGSLAYRYQCTVASDAKGDVKSEVLDWIYPA